MQKKTVTTHAKGQSKSFLIADKNEKNKNFINPHTHAYTHAHAQTDAHTDTRTYNTHKDKCIPSI